MLWAQEVAQVKADDPCWFLAKQVRQVLIDDLYSWRTQHNDKAAALAYWFNTRQAEVLQLDEATDVTEVEVATCLESLWEVTNGKAEDRKPQESQ